MVSQGLTEGASAIRDLKDYQGAIEENRIQREGRHLHRCGSAKEGDVREYGAYSALYIPSYVLLLHIIVYDL